MKLCHNTALEPYSVRLLLGLLRMEARVLMMMGMQLVQLLKGMPLNKVSLSPSWLLYGTLLWESAYPLLYTHPYFQITSRLFSPP